MLHLELMKISRESFKEISIREYRPADAAALYQLDLICFEPAFRFSINTMKHFAEEQGAITLLAEGSGKLAGFCIVQMNDTLGYVITLDVAPEWRRRGLASFLMSEMEERVVWSGGDTMALHVYVENLAAIRLYESAGYTRVGISKAFYAPRLDAFIYRKPL